MIEEVLAKKTNHLPLEIVHGIDTTLSCESHRYILSPVLGTPKKIVFVHENFFSTKIPHLLLDVTRIKQTRCGPVPSRGIPSIRYHVTNESLTLITDSLPALPTYLRFANAALTFSGVAGKS